MTPGTDLGFFLSFSYDFLLFPTIFTLFDTKSSSDLNIRFFMQSTRKLQSKLYGSFGQMSSPGQIPAPPDQLKIIVNFNPVIMLVLSFSRSQSASAEGKIAFRLSFYVIHSAKEKQE